MPASRRQLALLKKVRGQRATRVQRLLAAARNTKDQAKSTLEQLQSYRSDYENINQESSRIDNSAGSVVSPSVNLNPLQLANSSRFLNKLDAAVEQQTELLKKTERELEQVKNEWQQLYLNDQSLTKFIAQRERVLEKESVKRDDRAGQSNWLSSVLSQSEQN